MEQAKALGALLATYRAAAQSQREKGNYFESLILAYLRNEPRFADLYDKVWTLGEWAAEQGRGRQDVGIDLVARTRGTGQIHAIQCKLYAEDHKVTKADIDSFFTASGQRPFEHRLIVTTSRNWTQHAEDALADQHIPVTRIDLTDLENSLIDWSRFSPSRPPPLRPRKEPRPHQVNAIKDVLAGLSTADRGKMIMACGTGKTFAALKIAQAQVGAGGLVVFLAPSLALVSQTLHEWTQDALVPLHSFAVCSDTETGKIKHADPDSDRVQVLTHELRYPATTSPERLAQELAKRHDADHMSVIFATYHSIDVIHQAQRDHGLPVIDLVVCDEAHRTTGSTFADEDDSHFVKVHDNDYLAAAKRLYMTATPRIFADQAKAVAKEGQVALYSMDDRRLFGETLHLLTFSEAVKRGLLVDYKVIVLAIQESHVSRRIQGLLSDEDNQLRVDDASKIIGCWKALSKQGLTPDEFTDPTPMRRAVAFCQVIQETAKSRTRKVASKTIAAMFQQVVEAYQESAVEEDEAAIRLACQARHVDGSMSATKKEEKLSWLKEPLPQDTCRILSNVRCLSEGVDVPALDAVLFLTPRNSQVDVVQSVGRVMRLAEGKKRGYIVLPVVIPAGMDPADALNDNKTYQVVWQVLQALRSHDDRFDASINKLELTGPDRQRMEVIAVVDKAQRRRSGSGKDALAKKARRQQTIGTPAPPEPAPEQQIMAFDIGEIERAIYAKVVEKVGNRLHWEDWAKDIARIAAIHIDRIRGILGMPATTAADAGASVTPDPADPARTAFLDFARQLRADLNDAITDAEIIEMLAQHLITRPVFDALFEQYSFASHNPMSRAMQSVLDVFDTHHINKEAATLEGFYESVRMRVEGIKDDRAKQKIVVELYDRFFRNAFPKMADRLGIVYTPVEVVDFILHSVSDVLGREFGQSLGSPNVHIIDPFTGTGTFINRLIQSGLIPPRELAHKYRTEIHANEIVLLAYYIAAINIEAAYHGVMGGQYVPFSGICLTDTFQMHEDQDLVQALVPDNSQRRQRQKSLDIRVIVGNPPYSVGQGSANDINANLAYPGLDGRIRDTYAKRSMATNKNALYDSYIRAIRWASDRIGDAGVIGFVTNAGFVEAGTADGLRKCLAEEFSSIYVFHLRGNQRTSGEQSRKEGGKIFGSGSRAPIAITILVKNPDASKHGRILFHDIGDYLTREEKLEKIAGYGSVAAIPDWTPIVPDSHGDWLNQRDDRFADFIAMGDKKDGGVALFDNYSNGVKTQRDAWAFNADRQQLSANMARMIQGYNDHLARFQSAHGGLDRAARQARVDAFIDADPTRISWTRALKQDLARGRRHEHDPSRTVPSLYRPYTRQWLYFDRRMNEMVYQMPRLFPTPDAENLVIGVTGNSARQFSALMTNLLPDIQLLFNGQCFPLYLYDDAAASSPDTGLFVQDGHQRRDAITAEGLAHFQGAYPDLPLTREDVFYYTYAILHSPDYRQRFGDNLSKELPRIPRVRLAEHFQHFADAGRRLADLHLHFDTDRVAANADAQIAIKGSGPLSDQDYRVEKMRQHRRRDPDTRKLVPDPSTVIYNERISITNIPERAWDYVVNGKPALAWVMERQGVRTDKASGIVNDANAWAVDTMGNARYPLDLFLKVITVSLETLDIVDSLPALDVLDGG